MKLNRVVKILIIRREIVKKNDIISTRGFQIKKKGNNHMKIRALVVDDDKTQLKLFISFLKKLNFEGNTAANGEEAVDKMKNDGGYDICFMDIQMPVMDGVEATKIIKEEITKDTPIIAITAMPDFNYDKSVEMGMDDYLGKPVALEQLKEVIARHCNLER